MTFSQPIFAVEITPQRTGSFRVARFAMSAFSLSSAGPVGGKAIEFASRLQAGTGEGRGFARVHARRHTFAMPRRWA
jgi:hypothetical protein